MNGGLKRESRHSKKALTSPSHNHYTFRTLAHVWRDKEKKNYLGDDCAPKHNANISTFGKTITKTAIVRLTRMVMHEIKFALNFTS